MTKKSETKKKVTATAGHQLEVAALFTTTEGGTTQRHTQIETPNICYFNSMMDVSGHATTASNGRIVFRLKKFICPAGEVFHQPINVVATPQSSTPCFVTMSHTLINNGTDVEIKVFSWDAKGAAAPNVRFNWRCRVGFPPVVIL